MGIKIEVIIPSHKRAGRVPTLKAIDNAKICVPNSQKEEYETAHPDVEIIGHPDEVVGLTAKRQWIYEQYPNVLMVDDDIKSFFRLYTEVGEDAKMLPDEAYEMVQWLGNVAKIMGCYLFGLNKNPSPAQYQEHTPIKRTGYVGGTIGMLEGSKLYYDTDMQVVEDYQICALNAYHHRHCFIDTRFAVVGTDTFGNVGGCASYRTKEVEKNDTLQLRKKYGEIINLKKDTVLATRKHEYMRTLKIPF